MLLAVIGNLWRRRCGKEAAGSSPRAFGLAVHPSSSTRNGAGTIREVSGSSRVAVNGTELFVEDSGERHLPPVLALHSLFLDGRMFDAFADAAAGRYRVVRPDHRGQGRNPSSTAEIVTMDVVADDVEALVEALDLGPVHLLLSSMGGDVGLRFAARRPDRVRSMVLVGTSARAEPEDQLASFRAVVDDFRHRGFVDDLLEMLMQIMFAKTTLADPTKTDLLDTYRAEFAALPTGLAPAISGVVERASVLDVLPRITVPALVVSGSEDIPRPTEWADEMHEHLPDSQLWRLEGVGHSPLLEAAETVNSRVLDFFDKVESRTAARKAKPNGDG
jgi:3-oxoadipate enol-lactonase